jgi:hypothetical protein
MASPRTGADPDGYDRFGVPTSAAAAFAMEPTDIRDAVLRMVAFNDGCAVADLPEVLLQAEDGSFALDSVQAVFAAAAFSTGFGTGRKLVNLSKIGHEDWSSTGSVTNLLVRLINDRRADW